VSGGGPEEALVRARAAAAAARAEGAGAQADDGFAVEATDTVDTARLLEWAMIEPDIERVRSTRRGGAPITAAKRALIHVLRQYLGQIAADQTRFNHHLLLYASRLADRVDELERRVAELEGRPGGHDPSAQA